MKIFKRKLIKGTNWALAGLMSLFGFSCNGSSGGGAVCEYGTPHAEYKFGGFIKNEKGEALNGMRITVNEVVQKSVNSSNENLLYINDTVYTDDKGYYDHELEFYLPSDIIQVNMKVEDPKGQYEAVEDSVNFAKSELKGGEKWFLGAATKAKDFVLKQKK